MRLLGLDPGLRRTGWGVIQVEGTRLSHLDNGVADIVRTVFGEPFLASLLEKL